MGKSAPPPAPFDLVNSYARARGEAVEIVLADPRTGDPGALSEAVLRRGDRRVRGTARLADGPTGPRVVVALPRSELSDGTWVLRLRRPGGGGVPTRTRLLVQGSRPLVLLWGEADPDSRLPDPRPRTAPASSPRLTGASTTAPGRRARVAAAGGRALDVALSPLPEQRRRTLRRAARRAARRLLG